MSRNLVAVADWLGHHGEPLEPSAMQYTDRPAVSCRGCVFDGQSAKVCRRAREVAVRAGLGHCIDNKVMYVALPVDPRQLRIPGTDA